MKIQIAAAVTGVLLAMTACGSSTSGAGTGVRTHGSAAGSGVAADPSARATSAAAPAGGGTDANGWCGELEAAGPAIIGGGDSAKLPPNWQAKAEQLAADAPSEIRSDVQILIRGDEKIINGDAGADSTPQFLKAGQHVVTWLGTNCPGLMQKLNPGLSLSTG